VNKTGHDWCPPTDEKSSTANGQMARKEQREKGRKPKINK
jgi:hypothetical protein